MKALVLDISRDEWETTKGMNLIDVPKPELDEARPRTGPRNCR